MKNKPTKKQLVDRNEYFETAVKSLINDLKSATEGSHPISTVDILSTVDCLENLLSSAPSLEPQPKPVVVEEETAAVDQSEEPANV